MASRTVSYSGSLRRAFNLAAFVVALLPIPVAILHLLPAYRIHARFLAFFTPLVCLLTLAYLFYVRDSLARMMFAHLLDPLPARPDFYRERTDIRLRRLRGTVRRVFLALLPALLLLLSFACIMRYTERLEQSVAASGAVGALPEDVGLAPPTRERGRIAPTRAPARGADQVARAKARADAPDTSSVDTLVQRQALDAATVNQIPYFAELTAWYVGAFLAALVALAIMGFREYAKEALGLSERDVVLGRVIAEPE